MVAVAIGMECLSGVARKMIAWLVVVFSEEANWDWVETAQRGDITTLPWRLGQVGHPVKPDVKWYHLDEDGEKGDATGSTMGSR